MGDFLIITLLVAIVGVAIYSTVHRIRHGSACCGERDAAPKRIKVKDKNKANYAYTYVLKVDGMHCSNCARRVENAFNSETGNWAKADVEKKEVLLLSKKEESEEKLMKTVASAGYTMLSCERK
ncbi:MAG: heavy-metal-associated domain-containing protein [Lachnospiraceae bacterium]|nr:heavy-metal-associated domain-containing protein [Lachnospiraceae bacterium]